MTRRVAWVVIAVLCGASRLLAQAPTVDQLREFLADSSSVVREAEAEIERLGVELDSYKRARVTGRYYNLAKNGRVLREVPTAQIKREKIGELESKIARLKETLKHPGPPTPRLNVEDLKTGQVGMLDAPPSYRDQGESARRGTVLQVIDAENMLVTIQWGDILLWVNGNSTRDLADDDGVRLDGYWRVLGTRQYQSVLGGTKSVWMIAPFDIKPYLPANPPPAPEKAEEAAAPAAEIRTWSDATGQFRVEAEFRGMIGDRVQLRTKDGRSLEVPLERLSAADQDFIRKRQ